MRKSHLVKLAFRHSVVGATITILSTFAFSLWSDVNGTGETTPVDPTSSDIVWPDYVQEVWPKPIDAIRKGGLGFGVRVFEAASTRMSEYELPYDQGPIRGSVGRTAFGWPFAAADTIMIFFKGGTKDQRRDLLLRFNGILGWRAQATYPTWMPGCSDPARPRFVPIDIRWAGVAGNTIVFGAMSFGLMTVPGMWRRHSRMRRGLCPACAYDMRGLAVCPECGGLGSTAAH